MFINIYSAQWHVFFCECIKQTINCDGGKKLSKNETAIETKRKMQTKLMQKKM
jgi:hypothetical protein